MFSKHSRRLGTVANIYSRAATSDDAYNVVSLRCGEDHVWWTVKTLGHQWLENTELQMAVRNCHLFDWVDDGNGNGNLTGGGNDNGANSGKGKEPEWPDHCVEDDDHPSDDGYTRPLKCFPMCSQTEFTTELVSHLAGI